MGHPEWRGILSAVEQTEAAMVEAQINAEVPRSQMGAGERERRRELARKWAEKHHWQVMEEKEVRWHNVIRLIQQFFPTSWWSNIVARAASIIGNVFLHKFYNLFCYCDHNESISVVSWYL